MTHEKLFSEQAYINGQWLNADNGNTIEVRNPADGLLIGTVPNMGAKETTDAILSAHTAFQTWRRYTAQKRAQCLHRWFELMHQYADDLASLMTLEQGKPLAEALGEVKYAASFIEWFAEEGKRLYGDIIPSPAENKRLLVIKEPIGVCAAITPWNFPLAMITRKAAPALAAGCTLVLKPANETPYCALAMAKLAEMAEIPAGVFNVITGQAVTIGKQLTAHPLVRKMTFTGSTEVGRLLMAQCADTVKKVSFELGGNAPFIVFNDADIDQAITGAMIAKYRNAGQTCVCANRFYVQREIHAAFVEKLIEKVSQLKVGSGFDAGVQIGPLINTEAIQKVENLLQDAEAKGAVIQTGGHRHALGGHYFEPTVITHVQKGMRIVEEEIFGPIASVIIFDSEEEVIEQANDSIYGLAAYLYSQNLSRIWRVAESLEYGMVGINTGLISNEVAPFGGVKQSGLGREGSKYGIEDYVEIKYLCMEI